MKRACFTLLLAGAMTVTATDKSLPVEDDSNEIVDVSGKLIFGKEAIQQALGVTSLPDNLTGLIIVDVRVRPLTEKPLKINLDDFTLLSQKDGQKSRPFAPSEIAGTSTMVLKQTQQKGHGLVADIGLMGGMGGIGGGSAPNSPQVSVAGEKDTKADPLLPVLEKKVLPEKETAEPVSGLLYFNIDGKVKPKDLSLIYRGEGPKLEMRFKP